MLWVLIISASTRFVWMLELFINQRLQSLNFVNFGTVLCFTHREIANKNENEFYIEIDSIDILYLMLI